MNIDDNTLRHGTRGQKARAGDLDLSRPVDLVVLAVKERSARCRPLGADGDLTLRAPDIWMAVPGEIVTVMPRKQWSYAGQPYLSGEKVAHASSVKGGKARWKRALRFGPAQQNGRTGSLLKMGGRGHCSYFIFMRT